MLKRIQAARKTERGFTLIELLMVIVILGVLAGIVVFAVNGITDRGDVAACESDKKTTEIALEAYYANNDQYPTELADLTKDPDKFMREVPDGLTYAKSGSSYTLTASGC